MKKRLSLALVLSAAFITCYPVASQTPRVRSPAHARIVKSVAAPATEAALFISWIKPDSLGVFNATYHEISELRIPLPQELQADGQGNVYGFFEHAPYINLYKPPYSDAPIAIRVPNIAKSPQAVARIAVDPRTGLIAASSTINTHFGGPGGVTFFKPGQREPCNAISGDVYGVAFQSDGTLLYSSAFQDQVGFIAGGCNAKSLQPLTMKHPVPFLIVTGIDSHGNVVMVDNREHVFSYAPPSNGGYGNPLSTFLIPKPCYFRHLASDSAHILAWCGYGNLREIAYPNGGPAILKFAGPRLIYDIAEPPPVIP